MLIAPQTQNEAARVAALRCLDVLDTPPERAFDHLVEIAAQICGTPIALLTLVDRDRQWFKSRRGIDVPQTGRRESFCGHAIGYGDHPLVVEDANRDARFADNPLVTGPPGIRFYAGAPVRLSEGHALGTVCVIDRQPRHMQAWQLAALGALSRQASRLLEARPRRDAAADGPDRSVPHEKAELDRLMAIAAAGEEITSFVGTDFVYRFANDRFLEYWSRTRTAVVGLPMRQVLGARIFERQLRPLVRKALEGTVVDTELTLNYPGRGLRRVLMHLEPARSADGRMQGVVIRSRDVQPFVDKLTQMAEAIDQLERRTLHQERMLHILAHDLREPLNTVLNFSGLLQEAAAHLVPPPPDYLRFVQQGGARMKALLDDLARYVATAPQRVDPVPVDLEPVVQALQREFGAALAARGGGLAAGPMPMVEGDRALLHLLLGQLVANALRFAREGAPPQVRIDAAATDGGWRLSVTDNGPGVPDESRQEIFNLFRQLGAARERPGTGLGLALCRRVAEQHGGFIRVETAPTGQGSRFTVEWPRSVSADAAGAAPPEHRA